MKRLIVGLGMAGLAMLCAEVKAQDSDREIVLRKEIGAGKGNNEKLAEYTKLMESEYDKLEKQFAVWMKKFPDSASFPIAIGRAFYNHESPKATPYLLKASKITPGNPEIWTMLAIDAQRWGKNADSRTYLKRAADAAPADARLYFNYASSMKEVSEEEYKKLVWAGTDKFPKEPNTAGAISMMGYGTADDKLRIAIYEELRKRFEPQDNLYSAVAMFRLFDAYIRVGELDKAEELAAHLSNPDKYERFGFPARMKLARDLKQVRKLQAEKKFTEAYSITEAIVKYPPQFSGDVQVNLIKAEVADQAGFTRRAYDSLLVKESLRPDKEYSAALQQYAAKLGIAAANVEADVKKVRDKASYEAPDFELGLYTSDKKVKLADYRGKVIFMTYWFPGCGPCRAEMPYLEKVLAKYPKDKVAFIGIQTVPSQDAYVLPFMKGTGYTFTPLRGLRKTSEDYKVFANPTNFVIDQEGRVQYTGFIVNEDNEEMLDLMIKALLK